MGQQLLGPQILQGAGAARGRTRPAPAAAAMASTAACTVGISLTGQRCPPILAIAALSRVTAFSGFGLAPWPARPRAVSRSHAVPRSAEAMGYSRCPGPA